jgi:hypothetical protein
MAHAASSSCGDACVTFKAQYNCASCFRSLIASKLKDCVGMPLKLSCSDKRPAAVCKGYRWQQQQHTQGFETAVARLRRRCQK